MAESTDKDERINPAITYAVKAGKEITPEDIAGIENMAEEAVTTFNTLKHQGKIPNSVDFGPTTHIFAYKALKNPNSDFCAAFAYDNGHVVGYRIIPIKKETRGISSSYLGVAITHQRRGIASKLVTETHKKLVEMGIRSYETIAVAEVLELYKKAGVEFTVLEPPGSYHTEGYKINVTL
ncbi:MAG: hypothetical protein G01um10145_118 [Microgenomates group bacterium Gr01-1014_5]|nr:MAG: hypothetical protein G01um10145_118 [Microgenomates group bacterium Gr01-1014_5]